MKNLKINFQAIKNSYPYQSDFVCFVTVIRKRLFNKRTIRQKFKELINPDEYDKHDIKQILKFIYSQCPQKPLK